MCNVQLKPQMETRFIKSSLFIVVQLQKQQLKRRSHKPSKKSETERQVDHCYSLFFNVLQFIGILEQGGNGAGFLL